MAKLTLKQAAQWCGGQVDEKYADVEFLGANNDTRVLKPSQLFIVLQGARDGHDFVPMALANGAAAILCTHCDGDYPAIVVPDTRIALGEIARQEAIGAESYIWQDSSSLSYLSKKVDYLLHVRYNKSAYIQIQRMVS